MHGWVTSAGSPPHTKNPDYAGGSNTLLAASVVLRPAECSITLDGISPSSFLLFLEHILVRTSLPRCLCEIDACPPPLYLMLPSYQTYVSVMSFSHLCSQDFQFQFFAGTFQQYCMLFCACAAIADRCFTLEAPSLFVVNIAPRYCKL